VPDSTQATTITTTTADHAARLIELSELAARLADELRKHGGDSDLIERFVTVSREARESSSVFALMRDIEREREENRSLMQISMKLSSASDIPDVLKAILESLRHVVRFSAAGIFIYNSDEQRIEVDMMEGYEGANRAKLNQKFTEGVQEGKGIVAHVIFSGEELYVPDVSRDARYIQVRGTTRAEVAVPIKVRDELIGVFNLESDDIDAFSDHDRRLLATFAAHAGVALDRARTASLRRQSSRIQEEVKLARNIQQTFLPKHMPSFVPYDLGGMNFPSSEVGGDYFDFIPMTDSDLGVVIGDVSGHGVPAALMMANFRAAMRIEAKSNYAIPIILGKVNDYLYETNRPEDFVTAFYGVLDRRHHVFTYANAGHNPPFLIRRNDELIKLADGGLVLGAFPHVEYAQVRLHMEPGDVVVFYTDGVTESKNDAGEEFGEERLIELTKRYRDLTALEIARRLCHEVHRYQADTLQDDLTLSILKYDPSPAN
jgi:sigma-B regulation protein RsbU (phosphoserine phosphatase)